MTDEKEELLRWLQEKRDVLRFSLKEADNPTHLRKDLNITNVMKGQLDAYSTVIAFIMSEGKIR